MYRILKSVHYGEQMPKYEAPTVKKAFLILTLISRTDQGLGISELSKKLAMSKGTVHGITAALEGVGAIVRDPTTKRFTLGFTLFELGRLAYTHFDMKEVARPFMETIMEKTQASVFLGILNREHVTIIDIVESKQDLKITAPVGTTIPLLAGAVGKAFLASMEEAQALEIIQAGGLTRFTENTTTDPEIYSAELRHVREVGYATDYEEYLLGVRAVASPIQVQGQPMSAIWAVGFKASLDDENMKTLITETKKAAQAISARVRESTAI